MPHAACVDLLGMLLSRRVPEGYIVRIQNPIYLDEINEPQPDLAVLKPGNYRELQKIAKATPIYGLW